MTLPPQSSPWRRVLKRYGHWLVLAGLPLLAFGGYLGQGLSTEGDNLLHLYRLVALHKQIMAGDFYPRWLPDLFLGFGYPLLNFYASSTYYAAELFHLLGMGYAGAILATHFCLLAVAVLGAYRLADDLFADSEHPGRGAALVAAAAYVFAPYLIFNVYGRGAIAEVGAQALLPWLLWVFRRLFCAADPARYLVWGAALLAGLAFTHSVSLLLVPPILVVYAPVLVWEKRLDRHEAVRRLGWFAAACVTAAAVSAVFWLPALLERQFLTTQAQEAAARLLDQHTWTRQNWLDGDWTVAYDDGFATSLRRVPLLLAVLGAGLGTMWARRRGEWFFWVGLAAATCLLVGAWAAPLWRSHPLLLTVQFPWRLLGIAGLPLALLTGGIVAQVRSPWGAVVTALLLGLIVWVNYPRMEWLPRLAGPADQVNFTSIAQYEAITGRYGLSALTYREFTPRWVKDLTLRSVPPVDNSPRLDVDLVDADPRRLTLDVQAPTPARLILADLYFPGWAAQLADGGTLAPYPVSDFGLLAVDLPAGDHRLEVGRRATSSQRWGLWVTVGALGLLGGFYLRRPGRRRLALVPLIPLALLGILTGVAPVRTPTFHRVADRPTAAGLQLLGYTTYQETADAIYLFPTWYIAAPPTDVRVHWQLADDTGATVAAAASFPYFDTLRAFQWSANMLVDDGYYLPLPPGLPAGSYTLAVGVTSAGADAPPRFLPVGAVEVRHAVPPLPNLPHPQQAVFRAPTAADRVTLRGYAVERAAPAPDIMVAPGSAVTYTLYWQADPDVPPETQVFVQLLDHTRQTLTQVNRPLELRTGTSYTLWNASWLRANSYRLEIPADALGGLYAPYVGVYDLSTQARRSVEDADGAELGDGLLLPPIKVARHVAPPLPHLPAVQFGEAMRLEGYDVELPAGGLRPGATLTLTVQYRSLAPTSVDYTQFVHFQSPVLGMAAQVDAPPQRGGNPTSSWIAGEVVVDVISLQIAATTQPGRYVLALGLYNPADGVRLAASGPDRQPLPDSRVVLGEFDVTQ